MEILKCEGEVSTIITFTRGFEYKGVRYGWVGDKLFRLPFVSKNMSCYALMEIYPLDHNGGIIYRCRGDRITVANAKAMTGAVFWEVEIKKEK